jgi:hypothetical protein
MQDGKWLVPPEERPKRWELLTPIPASELKTTAILEDAIAATEFNSPVTPTQTTVPEPPAKKKYAARRCSHGIYWIWCGACNGFAEIAEAIRLSAQAMDADEPLIRAALVLVAGMWVRTEFGIGKLTGLPALDIGRIARRCWHTGLWCNKNTVILGEFTDDSDLEFWLNAMVASGECDRTENNEFRMVVGKV